MSWHLRSTTQPCVTCGKLADTELFDRWNAPHGHYCRRCGNKAVKTGNARDDLLDSRKTGNSE